MPRTTVVPVGFGRVQHELTQTGDPEPMMVTYGIDIDSPPMTLAQANAVSDAFNTFWTGASPTWPASYVFTRTLIVNPTEGPGPQVFDISEAGTPVGAGSLFPSNCAFLAHKRSGFGGRRNRGRWYIPGVIEAAADDLGVVTGVFVSALTTALTTFLTNLTAAPTNVSDMVLLHSYEWSGPVDPGPPVGFPAPTPVIEFTVDPKIGTQRGRLRR